MKLNWLWLVVGALIGAGLAVILTNPDTKHAAEPEPEGEAQPLYWVAPMDPNYRRDEPGLSPMGMELVPVFEESIEGSVKISSTVEHNLGVRTAPAAMQRLVRDVRTVGYVQYDEDRLLHVHPRVEGWIEKLFVKAEGDRVEQGQALYEIYSPQLVNAQEEFLLALSRSNGTLIAAAKSRLQALQVNSDLIARIQRTGKVEQTVTAYAPQSGVLDNLQIREGFFVKPDTTLMSIGRLDEVWVQAEVLSRSASTVKAGLPVSMTLDYLPGQVWRGLIEYVYPALDPETRTLRLRLRFKNPDELLKPNMFAQVVVHLIDEADRLVIPAEALIRTPTENRVIIAMGDGLYRAQPVVAGIADEDHVEIVSGLAAGDEVVTSSQFLLDSESSRSSGLFSAESSIQSAFVSGKVNEVDVAGRKLNISRGAIPKWRRGPATMDFVAASGLALDGVKSGDEIEFKFNIVEGEFVVTEIYLDQGVIND
jgi:Cu(I)/Ag(I) efflux system membrane fusion protein